ncbi:hypothetical protein QIS74_13665 [Colletotrichum tabaci]|uniref:Rhodopsin domain-containing protein n=1 Tax=Colletotrichum tabaci TaxID=1209068 RepID=A0AAV9SSQ5_9PEZI
MTELNSTLESTVTPSAPGNLVERHYYVFGVGFGISTLFSFLRLCQRGRFEDLGLDDLFFFFSWVFSASMQILMIYSISMKTMCYHGIDIPTDKHRVYTELSYSAASMFMLSIGCAKMSILFFCSRVVNRTDKTGFKCAILITKGAVIVATLTITALLFASRPASVTLDAVTLFLATASSNIVMDIVLLVLPIPVVYKLQMRLKEKLRIAGFFSLGLITTAISIVRLLLLNQVLGSSDLTWDAAPANITSYVTRADACGTL